MKRLVLLLVLPVCMLLGLTSCIQTVQLNETAIVQAIGIDLTDSGEFEVTLQIYSPKGAGASTAVDVSKNNSSVVTSTGPTLASAVRNATLMQGKEIFTGHNRILILGRSLAEEGIENLFSYFDRSALTRQNVDVLMADTSAKEVVSTNVDQGVLAAETIENMVENSHENGRVYSCAYYTLAEGMNMYHGSAVMPIISISQQEGEEEAPTEESTSKEIPELNKLTMEKSAVFNDFKLVGELDSEQTRGMLYLRDKIQETVLVADSSEGKRASLNIYVCKSRIAYAQKEGVPVFTLKLDAQASLDEVLAPSTEVLGTEEIRSLEEACRKKIESAAQAAFEAVVLQGKCDVFYLEDMMTGNPAAGQDSIEQAFYEQVGTFRLETEIDFQIDRVGMESDEKF